MTHQSTNFHCSPLSKPTQHIRELTTQSFNISKIATGWLVSTVIATALLAAGCSTTHPIKPTATVMTGVHGGL